MNTQQSTHHTLHADTIRMLCVKMGILERDLAQLLEINVANFSKYMNGHRRMSESRVAVMAAFFNVPWRTLVADIKETEKDNEGGD